MMSSISLSSGLGGPPPRELNDVAKESKCFFFFFWGGGREYVFSLFFFFFWGGGGLGLLSQGVGDSRASKFRVSDILYIEYGLFGFLSFGLKVS